MHSLVLLDVAKYSTKQLHQFISIHQDGRVTFCPYLINWIGMKKTDTCFCLHFCNEQCESSFGGEDFSDSTIVLMFYSLFGFNSVCVFSVSGPMGDTVSDAINQFCLCNMPLYFESSQGSVLCWLLIHVAKLIFLRRMCFKSFIKCFYSFTIFVFVFNLRRAFNSKISFSVGQKEKECSVNTKEIYLRKKVLNYTQLLVGWWRICFHGK